MKKRILAGVLALLMVASAMPLSDFADFVPDMSVTASAQDNENEFKPFSGKVEKDGIVLTYTGKLDDYGTPYLSINVTQANIVSGLGTPTVTVNTNSLRAPIEESIEKAKQQENASKIQYVMLDAYKGDGGITGNSEIGHVIFSEEDTYISGVGALLAGCKNLQTVKFNSRIRRLSGTFDGCTYFAGSGTDNIIDLTNFIDLGRNTFSSCTTLAGVIFNNSLTTIGESAFSGCINLTNINIPASTKLIRDSAFSGCKALKSCNFEAGSVLTYIGTSAFSGCTALSGINVGDKENTLPSGVERTGNSVFSGCTSLHDFTVPKRLKRIASNMFSSCSALRNVKFENGSECEYLLEGAFGGCSAMINIELPNSIKAIGGNVFSKCTNLEKIIVPDSIAAFDVAIDKSWKMPDKTAEWELEWEVEKGKYVPVTDYSISGSGNTFSDCPVLSLAPKSKESVLKPNQILMPDNVTFIPRSCFNKCTGITDVQMPNVTDIAESAFRECTALPQVTVPDAVTVIREYLFYKCSSLHTVEYSKATTQLQKYAFGSCSSLETMTPNGTEPIEYTIQFPKTLGMVCSRAFENCASFKYLNFLDADVSEFAIMEEGTFSGCSSLEGSTTDGTSSEELRFPKKVVVIEATVFEKCAKLKTVRFTGNVTSIGDSAFSSCSEMTRITLNPTVTQLGKSAFANCKKLQQLPMTETGESALIQLEDIKDQTFTGCESITEVNLSDAKNIEAIGASVFVGCSRLERVILAPDGKLGSIGSNAFAGCSKLSFISADNQASYNSLPDSVHTIGQSAFSGTSLENITIVAPANPKYYNVIGGNAFENCAKLEYIDLSQSNLSKLPSSFASRATALKEVKLPATLSAVGEAAFDGCKALEKINSTEKGVSQLPEALKSVGSNAFRDNLCISKVIIPAAADNLNTNAWTVQTNFTPADVESGKVSPLKEFVVDENNSNYMSIDGVLYNKKGTRRLLVYPVMKSEPDYAVPDFVEEIAENAIVNNKYIQGIKLTDNVKNIIKNSIKGCTGLRRVEFGTNTTVAIDNSAFTGLTGNPKVAFYAAQGSTAQAFAASHSNQIEFIDNDKVAVSLTIAEGSRIRVLRTDGKFKLTAVLLDKNGEPTEDVLVWTSSNLDAAIVDNTGNVTPKANGVSFVTVSSANGLSATIEVIVGATTISTDMVTVPEMNYVYDGNQKLQPVIVSIDDKQLTEGTDYTLSYTNNINAGTATVTVTGKGKYAGSLDFAFPIAPAPIDDMQVTFSPEPLYYTGSPLEPFTEVSINEKVLLNGRDYEVTFDKNVNVGKGEATFTGKGNYTSTVVKEFEISANPITDMIIDLSRSSFNYNGYIQKPSVTIANKDHELLTEGKDYTISIPESLDAGEYQIVINGIGGYCGETTASYWIAARSIDEPEITAKPKTESVVYDGTEKTVKVEVKDGTRLLTEGKDYTLSFDENINVGTAYATIIGIGNYQNSVPVSFEITPKPASELTVKLSPQSYNYDGSPKTPAVTVYNGNQLLELDTDYTFEYENNTDPGTAYVVITGKGNFSGTAKIPFSIVSKETIVERIYGANRFLTSVEISKKACSSADTVVIASGMSFADALAGVSYAKALNAPILLVAQNSISDDMLKEIDRLGAKNAVVLGGEGAVGAKVVNAVKNKGLSVERIAGKSRFDTAAEIAAKLKDTCGAPENLYFVYYNGFADALSVSSVAGIQGAPVLYVKTTGDLDDATKQYVASVKDSVKNVYVIGGTGVISDAMCKTIKAATGKTPERVAGANRYETCVQVNTKFADTVSAKTLCVATGFDFPDALAGGVFAAMNNAPLFLVNGKDKKSTLSDTQTAYIKQKAAGKLYVIGGTGAVPDAYVNKIKNVK